MHVYDMQKVPTFSSYSSRKITVWLSSCGREKKKRCEIWCALHNPLIYMASHNAPLLRVTLYCSAGCTRHYVIHATRSSLNDIGAAFKADHTSTDTWPLTQTNLDHCTSGTDGMQPLAARNSTVWVCVCLFASLSERRRCAGQQAPPTAAVLAPMRQMGKIRLSLRNKQSKTDMYAQHTHMLTAARRLCWEGSWITKFSDVHLPSILSSDFILFRQHPPSDQKGARHHNITATGSHTAHVH